MIKEHHQARATKNTAPEHLNDQPLMELEMRMKLI